MPDNLVSLPHNKWHSIESKDAVAGIFDEIERLSITFGRFVEHGADFYDHYTFYKPDGTLNEQSDELTELLILSNVKQLYFTVPAFILFMRNQGFEFTDYIREEKIASTLERLITLTDIDKKNLHNIYEFESVDMINDLYLTLKYCRFVFENFDDLLQDERNIIDILNANDSYMQLSIHKRLNGLQGLSVEAIKEALRDMREHMNATYDYIKEELVRFAQGDKITWFGTSTELAYLFEQLAYRGYIENPQARDGEMNKTGLARMVWGHIAPKDVKEETFIVDLRGSRLGENSAFAKAVNALPTNPKNDKTS